MYLFIYVFIYFFVSVFISLLYPCCFRLSAQHVIKCQSLNVAESGKKAFLPHWFKLCFKSPLSETCQTWCKLWL